MLSRVIPAGTVACVCENGAGGSGHEPDVEDKEVSTPDVLDFEGFSKDLGQEGADEGLERKDCFSFCQQIAWGLERHTGIKLKKVCSHGEQYHAATPSCAFDLW